MFSSDPNQPVQNYEIVNPALEQQVADLLPSVAGYGGNLRSTNTIIPIVDLTVAAEGATLPESLQQAGAFGSMTAFECANTTTALAATTGFWRFYGQVNMTTNSGGAQTGTFDVTDGVSSKQITKYYSNAVSGGYASVNFDFIWFLPAGHSISVTSSNTALKIAGYYRQVADVSGTLSDPAGFA